jgi:hypothetical protein
MPAPDCQLQVYMHTYTDRELQFEQFIIMHAQSTSLLCNLFTLYFVDLRFIAYTYTYANVLCMRVHVPAAHVAIDVRRGP